MKALSFFVALASAVVQQTFADDAVLSDFLIYQKVGTPVMSYQLSNDRDAFLNEALRLIHQEDGVKVRHSLNVSTQEIDFDEDFDVQFIRYAKVDMLTGKYMCGEDLARMKPMADKIALAGCLLDAHRVQIGPRGRGLDVGVMHDVTVSIAVQPMARSVSFWNYFNPSTYFDKSVTVEMSYIGR